MRQLGESCSTDTIMSKEEFAIAGKSQELKFEIINQIGVISTSSSGWNVELNRVSWNGKEPKYDLRSWSPDHTKMGKGITLTEKELIVLEILLGKEVESIKEC